MTQTHLLLHKKLLHKNNLKKRVIIMYTIDLIQNYNFDRNNENVMLFETSNDRETYFNNNTLFSFSNVNFNVQNLINTQVVIDFTKQYYGDDLKRLMNCFYCRIKDTKNSFYFFIDNIVQLSAQRISLQLTIDEFQTYFYDIDIGQFYLKRATTKRFKYDENNNKYYFNFDNTNTLLLKNENIPILEKRLTHREKLKFIYDTYTEYEDSQNPNNWLNDNIKCWVYYYMSPNSYKIKNNVDINLANIIYTLPTEITNVKRFLQEGASVVLCYPVYKENSSQRIIIKKGEDSYSWDFLSMQEFLAKNNNNSNVYSIKYSCRAPFEVKDYHNGYFSINSSNNLVITLTTEIGNQFYFNNDWFFNSFIQTGTNNRILCKVEQQDLTPLHATVDLSEFIKTEFSKEDIKTYYNTEKYNPKNNTIQIKELRLTQNADSYVYDIQKINESILTFDYYEVLTPDITKSLTVYHPKNNNQYLIEDTSVNYSGLLTSNDYSLCFSNDKLQEFLANNKNFFLQKGVNSIVGNLMNFEQNSIKSSQGSVLTKAGNEFANQNVLISGVTSAFGIAMDGFNIAIDVDNLQNAPDILKNASGNALFLMAIEDLGIYVNIYESIEVNKKEFISFLNRFGFLNNRMCGLYETLKYHYLYKHKYFDYVELKAENIPTNLISQKLRESILNKLERGVRFWYINNVDYDLPNYEREFDEADEQNEQEE